MAERTSNIYYSPRSSQWAVLTIFSLISLSAIVTANTDFHTPDDRFNWTLTAACVSAGLGLLSCLFHYKLQHKFVGTPWEGGAILLVSIMWIGGLPVILTPESNLAVSEELQVGTNIINANLYFSSWGAFASILVLAIGFVQDTILIVANLGLDTKLWVGLCACSVVTMVSSATIFEDQDCKNTPGTLCDRTKFAVILGVLSSILAFVVVLISVCKKIISHWAEGLLVFLFLITWCFGVALNTFGEGPAISMGNLFFSTWGSFLLSVYICISFLKKYFRKTPPACLEGTEASVHNGDVEEAVHVHVSEEQQEAEIVVRPVRDPPTIPTAPLETHDPRYDNRPEETTTLSASRGLAVDENDDMWSNPAVIVENDTPPERRMARGNRVHAAPPEQAGTPLSPPESQTLQNGNVANQTAANPALRRRPSLDPIPEELNEEISAPDEKDDYDSGEENDDEGDNGAPTEFLSDSGSSGGSANRFAEEDPDIDFSTVLLREE